MGEQETEKQREVLDLLNRIDQLEREIVNLKKQPLNEDVNTNE